MNNWKPWIESIKDNKYSAAVGLFILLAIPITLILIFRSQDTRSSAAAPDKLETEAGTLSSTGVTKQSDSGASGGSYVLFNKNSGPTPTNPPPSSGVGTGGTHTPEYVNVTGGGAMPSTSGGINVQDYGAKGDGVTDDTQALRNAANAARNVNKPLLIPKTNSFYKISSFINVYGSVIGIDGMPIIKQSNGDRRWNGAILYVMDNTTGWIYNLHLVGEYDGQYFNFRDGTNPNGEDAATIRLAGVNGLTIKGNILENPWGDGVYEAGVNEGYKAENVLVDNNTFTNPMRCAIALTRVADRWAILNNKIDYSSYYVNTIDLEPDAENEFQHLITNIEIGHNEYQVTSPYVVNVLTGWFDPTPGGNIWIHDNYGSWIGPFTEQYGLNGGPSAWYNVNVWNNNKTN